MSLFITSLNSGSNGNCYYVGNSEDAVLVDVGISCREIEKRMARLKLDMQKVKAVFISHEHTDHIKGLPTLVKKYGLPVYSTAATSCSYGFNVDTNCVQHFVAGQTITIGDIEVLAFSKHHDASDPVSFLLSSNGINIGVFTDIGKVCANVIQHFQQCHAVFLEANYDTDMLQNGGYPYHLKKRITGGKGHLSNAEALAIFREHRSSHLTYLVLSHLSQHNNSPELVLALFNEHRQDVQVVVAPRYEETPVFEVTAGKTIVAKRSVYKAPEQMAFSFA